MNATVTAKTGKTEKASSAFPTADILNYYETNAGFNSSDRGFIIEKGFQEWLLAVEIDHTAETTAAKGINLRAPQSGPCVTELVILIANLIGGVYNDLV